MSGLQGGWNKFIRNIVAGASDTEFEKVSVARMTLAETNQVHFPLGLEGAKGEACDL